MDCLVLGVQCSEKQQFSAVSLVRIWPSVSLKFGFCDPQCEVPGVFVSLDPGSDAAQLAGDQGPRGRLVCLWSCAAGIETLSHLGIYVSIEILCHLPGFRHEVFVTS